MPFPIAMSSKFKLPDMPALPNLPTGQKISTSLRSAIDKINLPDGALERLTNLKLPSINLPSLLGGRSKPKPKPEPYVPHYVRKLHPHLNGFVLDFLLELAALNERAILLASEVSIAPKPQLPRLHEEVVALNIAMQANYAKFLSVSLTGKFAGQAVAKDRVKAQLTVLEAQVAEALRLLDWAVGQMSAEEWKGWRAEWEVEKERIRVARELEEIKAANEKASRAERVRGAMGEFKKRMREREKEEKRRDEEEKERKRMWEAEWGRR